MLLEQRISVIRTPNQNIYLKPTKFYAAKIRLQNFFGFQFILVINTHIFIQFSQIGCGHFCRVAHFCFPIVYNLETGATEAKLVLEIFESLRHKSLNFIVLMSEMNVASCN